MSRRGSYMDGIAWIALNDEPSLVLSDDTLQNVAILGEVTQMISVQLYAHVFKRTDAEVAIDVLNYRKQDGGK